MTEVPGLDWSASSRYDVTISPDGQWWAWHLLEGDAAELWISSALAQTSVLLSANAAANSEVDWVQ